MPRQVARRPRKALLAILQVARRRRVSDGGWIHFNQPWHQQITIGTREEDATEIRRGRAPSCINSKESRDFNDAEHEKENLRLVN